MTMTEEDTKLLIAALIYYKSFIKKTRTADSHEFDKAKIERCDHLIGVLEDHASWRRSARLS